jgi:hypothetical protein
MQSAGYGWRRPGTACSGWTTRATASPWAPAATSAASAASSTTATGSSSPSAVEQILPFSHRSCLLPPTSTACLPSANLIAHLLSLRCRARGVPEQEPVPLRRVHGRRRRAAAAPQGPRVLGRRRPRRANVQGSFVDADRRTESFVSKPHALSGLRN